VRHGLTGSQDAVVAAAASPADSNVAERRHSPQNRAVAGGAVLRGLHVLRRFARCQHAVMAAGAHCCDPLVIKARRQPGQRRMAVLASVVANDMVCCLAGRENAVVAAEAVAGHAGVRHARGRRAARHARRNRIGHVGCQRRGGGAGEIDYTPRGRRCADHGAHLAAGRGDCRNGLLLSTATPVVGTVAAFAILAHMVIIRPRGQVGHAVETQGR